MDPTTNLCKIINNFQYDYEDVSVENFFYYPTTQKLQFISHSTNEIYFPYKELFEELEEYQNNFFFKEFIHYRNLHYPFEKLTNFIFGNRASLKLANLDALFSFFGECFEPCHLHSQKKLTFCDIAGGPGSFTQYIQYRFPN